MNESQWVELFLKSNALISFESLWQNTGQKKMKVRRSWLREDITPSQWRRLGSRNDSFRGSGVCYGSGSCVPAQEAERAAGTRGWANLQRPWKSGLLFPVRPHFLKTLHSFK